MKLKNSLFTCLFFILITITVNSQVPNYVPTNGLVAWYSFNNSLTDLSGNGNTPVNSGATFVNDRFGNPTAALDFNGVNAYMTVNMPNFQFSETGEFSYSFWLNKQSQTSAGVVLMNGSNVGGNLSSIIQGQNVTQLGVNKQQSAWTWASCPHTLNVWDHYVATYNAGAMSVYKNGLICTTALYPLSGAISTILPLYFGRGLPGATNFYHGSMDDIGIWTRELTPQEVTGLYTYAVGMEELSNKTGLMAYPNPAQDFINVKLNASVLGTGYIIMNTAGKVVMSGNLTEEQTRIIVRDFAAGTYLLKTDDGGKQSFSILKN